MHYYFYATIAAGLFTLAAFCIGMTSRLLAWFNRNSSGRCIQMRKNSSSNKSHWQFKFNIPAFCLNIAPLIFGIYVLASAEGERTSELDKNHAYPENYCYPLMWKAFLAAIITSSIFLAYCFVEILIIRCCLWDVADKNDPSRENLRMSYRHTKPKKTSSSRLAGHSRSGRNNYHRGSAHDPFGTAH